MIEAYFSENFPVRQIAHSLHRSRQTIYKVIHAFKQGQTVADYYQAYLRNKSRCGRKEIHLSSDEQLLIEAYLKQDWSLDVIKGCFPERISCSMRSLYRLVERGIFQKSLLPFKGKRRPNGQEEKRGKQAFRRTLREREASFPDFFQEFGHLEGDTIVGKQHKSAAITLVERQSKAIIVLKTKGRKASDIEEAVNQWMSGLPKGIFKSITFDCGKEFSNWKSISNQQDIDIFFADPGCPGQRGLNEHSNGLLRRKSLPKETDFSQLSQQVLSEAANKRNEIPRKSLNYRTPWQVFLELSSLI